MYFDPSITWYHAPNKSPSHSGVIERIVGAIRKPLIKTLQGAILTETKINAILTDIEACINSRPLAKSSKNTDDENLSCITPSHQIIEKTLRTIHPEIHQHKDLRRKI